MGICAGRFTRTETRSAQTDLNQFYEFSNRELINARYHNYKPMSVHSRANNSKSRNENVQLKNSIINDWKHPNRYDYSFMKSENPPGDNCFPNSFELPRHKFDLNKTNGDSTPTPSGVWPINGSGDCNFMNLKKRKNLMSQSRVQLDRDLEKSNLNININFSDEDENLTQRNIVTNDNNTKFDQRFQSQLPISTFPDCRIKRSNSRKLSNQRHSKTKELSRSKSSKKLSNQKIKLGNNNSNNYHSSVDDKIVSNSVANTKQFHSSSLLDQDCYPIQYTFYVDDNDICTKPFYDRRMVAIAKTCRCRIYFHAKADETEKPLYYKGKPVRPVTITSPDMACLKRCLGSIDSQFPNFNCKAFLSLSS